MKKFQSLDRTARTDQSDQTLATIHQNTITGMNVYGHNAKTGRVTSLSTCGADSQLVIWNFQVNIFIFQLVKIECFYSS